MPKINVYLPDDLAEAVRDTGVPVSAICQRALEQAVRRITAIRQTALADLSDADLAEQLPAFTARAVTVLTRARDAADPAITTAGLLDGIVGEGANLALQVLRSMEIAPQRLQRQVGGPAREPGGPSFSTPAATAIELAVGEATALGHNYVGCEHLLIGLAAEPDGAAGRTLREVGADAKAVRRAVAAALAGYAHLRAQASPPAVDALKAAVRQELALLVRRIEALEARVG
jgi:ATP-dependent Clp protease ATP-binding subunit ClpC